jgi:hypothetical protein
MIQFDCPCCKESPKLTVLESESIIFKKDNGRGLVYFAELGHYGGHRWTYIISRVFCWERVLSHGNSKVEWDEAIASFSL